MTDEQTEVVERALAYPFAVPDRSYALVEGAVVAPEEAMVGRSSRAPLLAYGSNASPQVLVRKLGPDAEPVLVARARLSGFDAVYSAHVAAYGSVPATLLESEATELPLFVAFVTGEQVEQISLTEPNYELRSLAGISCGLEDGGEIAEAIAYLSRHGSLLDSGRPVAVAEMVASGRTLPAMSQREVLEHVRRLIAPDLSLEEFVLDCVAGRIDAGAALAETEA